MAGFRPIRREFNTSHKNPLFFKLFMGFITTFIVLTFIAVGYGFYVTLTDPAAIGRMAGEVVSGFNEKVK